ncbi:MAG: acetyl-CoA carboxylase biotin carboxyl carrier protein [Gomphosphaeria aponina SAG 52.96 = DSM 107014]|uniref:Biotin carboxyl carrier protein of acetyl-CoA carboxylase n=1 Tax=Gomphosphaeria aponina SAG 52.96 = DSM 107014 TaxID=1521640 RepID=A0A941GS29_9CHRO|nr:acetyl-CoA carboxylase biotin carboxyl carrier protein [Gomphosphaeria aponina SAG 52.96 = DSM 107014]
MSIDFNQLREFLVAIAQTEITELTIKSEALELTLRKNSQPREEVVVVAPPPSPPDPNSLVIIPPETETTTPTRQEAEKKWVEITSPMVGTFYRAPAPGEAPFVEKGDRIRSGQTVCIIEAMKLMNEIEAEVSGQVMKIVVENGNPVEYGQTLMWINPG